MTNNPRQSLAAFSHRWLGLLLSGCIVLLAVSGLILNHRSAVARLDVSRAWLPETLQYNHWNNAALRGAVPVGQDEILLYGGIGVWRAAADFTNLRAYNRGLPLGSDRRQIERLFRTTQGQVLAGTRYGLYQLDAPTDTWRRVALPGKTRHVVDLAQQDHTLYVLTRSEVLAGPVDQLGALRPVPLPPPPHWDGKTPLFRVLWQLHDGTMFGLSGKLLVDFVGLAFIGFALSGVWIFLGPKWIRWRQRRGGSNLGRPAAQVRWCRKWHRRIGIVAAGLLIGCAGLGMFLRPPLLIAIIQKRVKVWPALVGDASPWHDRLRRLHYDASRDQFLLSTADGFYIFNASLQATPYRPVSEPPVSVMGVKVLEQHAPGVYLVGSFRGLYMWCPEQYAIMDWITRTPPQHQSRLPFGQHLVSGYLRNAQGQEFVADYQHGIVPLRHTAAFPAMPAAAKQSPISLWNLALEIHTGRIYQLIPEWLWVTLSGLSTLLVLGTGVIWWWKLAARTRRRRRAADRSTPGEPDGGASSSPDHSGI